MFVWRGSEEQEVGAGSGEGTEPLGINRQGQLSRGEGARQSGDRNRKLRQARMGGGRTQNEYTEEEEGERRGNGGPIQLLVSLQPG